MSHRSLKISFFSALTLDNDLHKTRELEILKALTVRGHITTLVAITSKNHFQMPDKRVNLIPIPIRYVPLISPLVWAVVLLFFLPFHVLISKPDFVIMDPELTVLSAIPTRLVLRFSKAKFILDIRSTPVEVIGLGGHLKEFFYTVSVLIAKNLFEGIAIVTSSMKREVCRKFGLNENSVDVWTNGVPLSLFDPQNLIAKSEELKKKLGLTERFVVFYHGAFSPTRGLIQTVEAMQIVVKSNSRVVLFFLGTGSLFPEVKELIQKKNLENNVILHDPVLYEEVPVFIGISNVCIVPLPNNKYWRFQNALNLLEYLAMEKVVIATDITANRSVVEDEKCCIFLNSVSPTEIARSIGFAVANKNNLDDWGKTGRALIQRSYAWDKVAEKVEQYLFQLDPCSRDLAL